MKRYTYYIILLLAMFTTSCSNSEFEYSSYQCQFRFDNTASRSAALASAMNADAPGIFCHIAMTGNYFTFTTNQSLSDRVTMSAIEEESTIILGLYNGTGIIVGYGNAGYPFTFYAYDSQCPNCYKNTSLPRYTLTMNTDGTAQCGSCNRKYDMNNGGLVISGDNGDKMIRYRAFIMGNVLSVNNI